MREKERVASGTGLHIDERSTPA